MQLADVLKGDWKKILGHLGDGGAVLEGTGVTGH